MLLLSYLEGYGQYYFERYSIVGAEEEIQGSIAEGSDGFMWIGSVNGLYRFDGKSFRAYRNNPEDSTSLQADRTYDVLAVNGQIWVGTDFGISVLDLYSQKFKNYTFYSKDWSDWKDRFPYNRVQVLYQDRQGEIWIGTNSQGLWRYLPENGTFQAYSERVYPVPPEDHDGIYAINAISQSAVNDSIIWVGTNSGMFSLNKFTGVQKMAPFYESGTDDKPLVFSVQDLYAHEDGLIYLGSWTLDILTYDPQTGSLRSIEVSNDADGILSTAHIYKIIRRSADQIWITTSKGVVLYNTKDKRLEYSKKNNIKEKDLYGISLIDRRSRFWFNTKAGFRVFDPQMQQFEILSYQHLYSGDVANTMYIEYDTLRDKLVVCPRRAEAIYHFDRKNDTYKAYPIHFPPHELDGVYGFAQINNDEYVLSTRHGVYTFSLVTRNLRQVKLPPSIDPRHLRNVLVTKLGEIWLIANHDGLYRTDRNFEQFTRYQKELEYGKAGFAAAGMMFEDSRHNVWIKRQDGISVYDRKQDTIHNFIYPVSPDNSFIVVHSFAEDDQGHIWVCSNDGMTGYMDAENPELGVVRKFTGSDFGLDDIVWELASDAEGNIWGYTPQEIIRITPADLSIQKYSLRYGAQGYSLFDMDILPDDEIYIGGSTELLRTNPRRLRQNSEPAIPYISSISIKNEEDAPYPLFGKVPIHLKHYQNFFTIFYAAQAYTLGDKVTFRYRLNAFEDKWNEVGNSQVATYTNVPSGQYTFELQAANNEGVWNGQLLKIPIDIHQPWYKAWWFYLSVALFLALMIFSVYQYRINQVRNEAEIRTAYEKKLAEVEMNALLAQMNPHFIFNSLNSIDSFILKNDSRRASEYLNDFARLIRLILQNSRSESIPLADELETLELYLKMEQLRFKDKFEYHIMLDPTVDANQMEIPPMLIQPYVENAIWHGIMHLPGGRSGCVEISIFQNEGQLYIQVTDNGVGRQRSMEIKETKVKHKKSMGMQITRDRLDLINTLTSAKAQVNITDLYNEDLQASGTKVFITLSH